MLLLTAFLIFEKPPTRWGAESLKSRLVRGRSQQMEMAVANPVSPFNPVHVPHEDRKVTAQRIANEMFHQQPDWIAFFREVLGVDGLLRKLFTNPDDLAAFEK